MQKHLWLVVLCCLITGCTKAPVNNSPSAGSNASDPPAIKSVDVVKATPQEATITRGESGDILIPIKITQGYHVNANPPSYSYLKATELELPQTDGISVEFISYPNPLMKKFSFSEGKELAVYEGEAILKALIKVDKAATTGLRNLPAKLRVQACDDKVCYAPGVMDVNVPVNIK